MADSETLDKNWYSILGACPEDDTQELKRKYQKLVLMFHPDKRRAGLSEAEAEQHLQRFIDIDQAWKVLGDEESRRKYDIRLQALRLKQVWPVDAHVSLDDMDWDGECYTYGCRCGGEFVLENEDTPEVETLVCCDSCSLSIQVKKVT